jgi:AcrR family transcriptional regulator
MPPRDRPRADGRSLRRVETRRRLLEATRKIIARRGAIEAVPIEEIAEEAGVSTGSFHNHFASKEALFDAAVKDAAWQHAARLAEWNLDLEDAAEAVASGTRRTVRMVREDPIWGAVAVRTGIYLDELWSALRDLLEHDLRRGAESRRFLIRDIDTMLVVIAGATAGVMMGTLEGELAEDADSQLAELMLRLLGLRAGEAREIAGRPLHDRRQPRAATEPKRLLTHRKQRDRRG